MGRKGSNDGGKSFTVFGTELNQICQDGVYQEYTISTPNRYKTIRWHFTEQPFDGSTVPLRRVELRDIRIQAEIPVSVSDTVNEELQGWIAGDTLLTSTYPTCLTECQWDKNCVAIRYVVSSSVCDLLSRVTSASDGDNKWKHIRIVLPQFKHSEQVYVTRDSGMPDLSLTENECRELSSQRNRNSWDVSYEWNRPQGCYRSGSDWRFAPNGNQTCGTVGDDCVERRSYIQVTRPDHYCTPSGASVYSASSSSFEDCIQKCEDMNNCNYASYGYSSKWCYLTEDCVEETYSTSGYIGYKKENAHELRFHETGTYYYYDSANIENRGLILVSECPESYRTYDFSNLNSVDQSYTCSNRGATNGCIRCNYWEAYQVEDTFFTEVVDCANDQDPTCGKCMRKQR